MKNDTTDFLDSVYELDARDQSRKAVDVILEFMDDLLNASRFAEVNEVFRLADLGRLSDSSMVSMLGITLAAKRLLPDRDQFWQQVYCEFALRDHPAGSSRADKVLGKYR